MSTVHLPLRISAAITLAAGACSPPCPCAGAPPNKVIVELQPCPASASGAAPAPSPSASSSATPPDPEPISVPEGSEVALARADCDARHPTLAPKPGEFEAARRRVIGRWYACNGIERDRFLPGLSGSGLEFTKDGRWYVLDATDDGRLQRRPHLDFRDRAMGRWAYHVNPQSSWYSITYDVEGEGGLAFTIQFGKEPDLMVWDQEARTRFVRVR